MKGYHINDIERLTGIKAHTIRIWEKRYHIVSPHRTATNIRYYDDEQLRKLLNVATLLQKGEKISDISGLSNNEITEKIKGIELAPNGDAIADNYINNLVGCMAAFDETGFEKIFSSAVNRFGIYHAMLTVFYPFLHKTGVLWSADEILPAQEHFASNIVKRKLFAAIDGLLPANKTGKKFLLYLPPGEWHEISLLFADYIIRSHGYSSLYLGQSVPYENLEITISRYKPSHVLGFYITEKEIKNIEEGVNKIAAAHLELQLLVSGSSVAGKICRFHKNARQIDNPLALVKLLE